MPPLKPWLAACLRSLLLHPRAAAVASDLDSAEASAVHAELIRSKGFLRRLYLRYYAEFAAEVAAGPAGPVLEVGAGSGFAEQVLPRLVRLDLRAGSAVDVRASALELPFRDGSLACVCGLDVLHHLPDPLRFLKECARTLQPGGGLVLIEPFVSPLSRRIYGDLHHEGFDPEREGWTQPVGGPMSAADAALAWVVLVRDQARLRVAVPELLVQRVSPHTISLYLLSGGVSMRSLAPGGLLPWVAALEDRLPVALHRRLASMMTVVLRRASDPPEAATPAAGRRRTRS